MNAGTRLILWTALVLAAAAVTVVYHIAYGVLEATP
jgi:hypothetical protein